MWQVLWSEEGPEIVTISSLLTMWCKQVTARSAMISVSLQREKALSLSIKYFRLCNGWIDGFKQDTVVHRPVSRECRTVGSSAVEVWRIEQLLKVIEGYGPENMYSGDEAGLFFMLPPNKDVEC
jgi:hypothetical protein